MKKIVFLIIIIITSISMGAQNSYKVVFNGSLHTSVSEIVDDSFNNFIVCKLNYPFGTTDVITSEIYSFNNCSSADTVKWNISFSRKDTSFTADYIHLTKENGYIIAGIGEYYTNDDTLKLHSRFNWTMGLDSMKNVVWEKCYNLPNSIRKTSVLYGFNLLELKNGNYLIAETAHNDSIMWKFNILLTEINHNGEFVKQKVFNDSISGDVMSLGYNYDSTFILLSKWGYQLYDCPYGIGAFLLDNQNYNTTDGICFHNNKRGFDKTFDVMLNKKGELIIAGSCNFYNPSTQKREWYLGIQKYDTSYSLIKETYLTNPDTITYAAWDNCLDINQQGEICVAGSFDNALGFFTGYNDLVYIAKLDQDLNLICERYIGRDAEYTVNNITATTDGGIAVGGYQYDYLVNEEDEGDAFIIKTNAGLWLDTPDISDIEIHRAIVYPNPGQQQLLIRTTVKNAVFTLFDLVGNEVVKQNANQLTTTINTNYLQQGVYIWTISKNKLIVDKGKWIKN